MNRQELTEKVINAQAKVEKKAEIIRKHLDRLHKLISQGADEYEIRYKQEDIKTATKKLEEAKQVLENWKSKLDQKISEDEYLEANTPEVIKTFLEGWKQRAIGYYTIRYAEHIKFRKDLRQQELDARREALNTLPELERARELYKDRGIGDYELHNLFPRKPVEDFLRDRGLDYYQVQKKIKSNSDGVINRMYEIGDEAERAAWLDAAMEQEKREKLLELTGRIMKVVGRITDVSYLSIGKKGDINGYIEGTEGKATIETIGAGGYNIQCYHFRTLIHEYK